MSDTTSKQQKDLPLEKAVTLVLDESRMILPGIQALFGFQLMVVFSDAFPEKLSILEQRIHLLAIALLLITTMTIMTQAVFHRQTGVKEVDERFIHIATRLLLFSMMPLAVSVSMEFYLISRLILNNVTISLFLALGIFVLFLLLWMVLPRFEALQRIIAGKR